MTAVLPEQTLGQRRVRTSFNPSGNDLVDDIKAKTAELIDLCETAKSVKQGGEALRCLSLAQTAFEDAAMWAVKAATA